MDCWSHVSFKGKQLPWNLLLWLTAYSKALPYLNLAMYHTLNKEAKQSYTKTSRLERQHTKSVFKRESLGYYNTLDHFVHTLRAKGGVGGTKSIQAHLERPEGRNVSPAFFIILH